MTYSPHDIRVEVDDYGDTWVYDSDDHDIYYEKDWSVQYFGRTDSFGAVSRTVRFEQVADIETFPWVRAGETDLLTVRTYLDGDFDAEFDARARFDSIETAVDELLDAEIVLEEVR